MLNLSKGGIVNIQPIEPFMQQTTKLTDLSACVYMLVRGKFHSVSDTSTDRAYQDFGRQQRGRSRSKIASHERTTVSASWSLYLLLPRRNLSLFCPSCRLRRTAKTSAPCVNRDKNLQDDSCICTKHGGFLF